MRSATVILPLLALVGCATGSVRMISPEPEIYASRSCSVEVYQSREFAAQAGMTREICRVEGSSAFSFDHSVDGAIKRNISKVCECGATKAYVVSGHTQSEMGIKGVSYINLVGFE